MSTTINIMFSPGRLVSGSLYELNIKDDKGKEMPEAKHNWSYGVAIAKNGTTDWKTQTDWGRAIMQACSADWPNGEYNHPAFSFKVKDGDGATSNKPGQKAPRDHEGWPGHWVIFFRRGKQLGEVPLVNADGSANFTLRAQKKIKKGDFIQVFGSVKGTNDRTDSPGCYVNDEVVAFVGEGPAIVSKERHDPTKLGFGGALPAGATPVSASAGTTVGTAYNSTVPPTTTGAPTVQITTTAVPQVAVQPHNAFLTPGVAPAAPMPAPAVPVAPPVPAGPVMTAKAGGASYESFKAGGWTDDQMRAHGYLV